MSAEEKRLVTMPATTTDVPDPFAEVGGTVAAVDKLAAGLASAPSPDANTVQYFRVGQDGDEHEGVLTFGLEFKRVHETDLWVPDLLQASQGWRLRPAMDGVAGPLVSLFEQLPGEPPLPRGARPHEFRWAHYYAVECVCIRSENGLVAEHALWSTDSRGFMKAMHGLLNAIIDVSKARDGIGFPVFVQTVSSYKSSKWGKEIYEPQFEIVDWLTPEMVFQEKLLKPQDRAPNGTAPGAVRTETVV